MWFKVIWFTYFNQSKHEEKISGWWADETLTLEAIFTTFTEKLSVTTNDTRGLQECLHQWKKLQGYTSISKMVPKSTPAFLPANREALGHYFQDFSFYYQLAQCNNRTPIPITLRWQRNYQKFWEKKLARHQN